MSIENLRIAFSGPSGTGKTTLCKHLKEQGLNWQSTSAWDVLNQVEKGLLKEKFGYSQEGHLNVIQLGHHNPEFAIAFQQMVKNARSRQLVRYSGEFQTNPGLVIDRSPIDNIVYMYMQASMYMNEEAADLFITESLHNLNHFLDAIIFVPMTDEQPSVENNKSRISQIHYQHYVSSVFRWVFEEYADHISIPIYEIDTWNLEERKRLIDETLIQLCNA